MPFKILNHQILPRQLIMVSKVIDALILFQMMLGHYGVDMTLINPYNVPIIFLSLSIPFSLQRVLYTVS